MYTVFYVIGSLILGAGICFQIHKIMRYKSSLDVSMIYLEAIVVAHMVMLPEAIHSHIMAWVTGHGLLLVLSTLLLLVGLYYRRGTK